MGTHQLKPQPEVQVEVPAHFDLHGSKFARTFPVKFGQDQSRTVGTRQLKPHLQVQVEVQDHFDLRGSNLFRTLSMPY